MTTLKVKFWIQFSFHVINLSISFNLLQIQHYCVSCIRGGVKDIVVLN
jgi:hypothetical protein